MYIILKVNLHDYFINKSKNNNIIHYFYFEIKLSNFYALDVVALIYKKKNYN